MTDYLSRLVSRTLNTARVVQPRLPNRFEPPMPADDVPRTAVSSVERPRAALEQAVVGRWERTATRKASTAVAKEKAAERRSVQAPDAMASGDRSAPTTYGEDLAGNTDDGPDEAPLMVAVASRQLPAIESARHAAPPARTPSVADPQEPREDTLHRSTRTTTDERQGLRAPANRVDGPANRGPLTAMTRQSEATVRETPPKPNVSVHIGRIEVRVVPPGSPLPRRPAAPAPEPMLGLKDYLKGRREPRR
jgi:hypothetical protein